MTITILFIAVVIWCIIIGLVAIAAFEEYMSDYLSDPMHAFIHTAFWAIIFLSILTL